VRVDVDEVRTAAKQQVKAFENVFASSDVQVNHMVLAPGQEVPWHLHTQVRDTLYVLGGPVTIYTRAPEGRATANTGETVETPAGAPHRVVNESDQDIAVLLIQGVGEYDFQLVVED
jgi:quercetin dioxygenase-like cupin family protein